MGAKPVEKVIGAKDGGGASEATAAANALAEAARTKLAAKLAAESLVLPKRKLVKKMVWDYMARGVVAAACSTSFRKKKISPGNASNSSC
ncbi:hypothetical protein RHGRI_031734 [Rhododendron griersonianum]|uniref:Uncharacterized protein n=1 Tax=Rhododendron griersonianum TaxID=479676 RepID=A0AAV6I9E6_9ERIC|nr:hypothetical protein RHGRI_031734 [Rhododendron griersonianum]